MQKIFWRRSAHDLARAVLCTAFRGRGDYPNLTVKKIPKQVQSRRESGHDDYNLRVENLSQKAARAGAAGAGSVTIYGSIAHFRDAVAEIAQRRQP